MLGLFGALVAAILLRLNALSRLAYDPSFRMSRAQARGSNQREPRSGPGTAIPRCQERFGRLLAH